MNYDWRKSFEQLARLVGVNVQFGWITKLSEILGYKRSLLANWIERGAPDDRLRQISDKGYPPETWLVTMEEAEASASAGGMPSPGGSDLGPLSPEEATLIKALREIDPISRRGIYLSALTQLNEAMRERAVRKDKRKRELLERAARILSRVVGGD